MDSATTRIEPRVFNWGARALYLGPALKLSPHRNAVAVLAAAFEGSFKVANDASNPALGHTRCRTAIVPPNTLHHFTDIDGPMAFLYLDARSDDLKRLLEQAVSQRRRASFQLQWRDRVSRRHPPGSAQAGTAGRSG